MDTEGFVLRAKIHSAKVMDWDGIKTLLLWQADTQYPRLKHLWVDAGSTGEKIGARSGWKRSSDGAWSSDGAPTQACAPKEVLMAWAEQWMHTRA